MVVRESSDNTANDAAASPASAENMADLQEILRQLCQELREIWRLPEEERRRAMKRLYLKWHPDKSLLCHHHHCYDLCTYSCYSHCTMTYGGDEQSHPSVNSMTARSLNVFAGHPVHCFRW